MKNTVMLAIIPILLFGLMGCSGTPAVREYYDVKCTQNEFRTLNSVYCNFLSREIIPARPGVSLYDFGGVLLDMTLRQHNDQLDKIGAR